jgi:hypothetical protein
LLLQVIQVVLLGGIVVQVMAVSNFKLNLTLTIAAVALVGTCFEIYGSVVKRAIAFLGERLPFLGRNKVITNEESGV